MTYQRPQFNIISENIGLKKGISSRKCERELLILEAANKMRKVICMLLGFLLIVSGCSSHITAHCQNLSYETSLPPDMRENYHPTITPVTDVAAGCYCHVEDAVLAIVAGPVIVAYAGICVVASIGGGESVVFSLDALFH